MHSSLTRTQTDGGKLPVWSSSLIHQRLLVPKNLQTLLEAPRHVSQSGLQSLSYWDWAWVEPLVKHKKGGQDRKTRATECCLWPEVQTIDFSSLYQKRPQAPDWSPQFKWGPGTEALRSSDEGDGNSRSLAAALILVSMHVVVTEETEATEKLPLIGGFIMRQFKMKSTSRRKKKTQTEKVIY